MDREDWNIAYANRLQEVHDLDLYSAIGYAVDADDYFNDGQDPSDAADDEMTYWDADE